MRNNQKNQDSRTVQGDACLFKSRLLFYVREYVGAVSVCARFKQEHLLKSLDVAKNVSYTIFYCYRSI